MTEAVARGREDASAHNVATSLGSHVDNLFFKYFLKFMVVVCKRATEVFPLFFFTITSFYVYVKVLKSVWY